MKKYIGITALVAIFSLVSCKPEKDTVVPTIDVNAESFPIQCSEVKRGENFTFKARFLDNVELGSFGIDVHNNFDHHNHSTEVGECDNEPDKIAVNPYVLLKNYTIPAGLKTYDATVIIDVPSDVDTGDYHFVIKVTDKAGWQTLKGLSVKIVE